MSGVKVTVSAEYDRWIRGFGNLDAEMRDEGQRVWEAATDVMFERSQQFAHVLSGENKTSGSAEAVVEGREIVGRITYDSDHAIYEEMRGGEHAFLGRAWEATESLFRNAVPRAWEAVVSRWR